MRTSLSILKSHDAMMKHDACPTSSDHYLLVQTLKFQCHLENCENMFIVTSTLSFCSDSNLISAVAALTKTTYLCQSRNHDSSHVQKCNVLNCHTRDGGYNGRTRKCVNNKMADKSEWR